MSKEDAFELKDFIKKSLLDICQAVEEAREQCPYVATDYTSAPGNAKPDYVEFDVAVTVSGTSDDAIGTKTEAGGGIKIGILNAGTKVGVNGQKSSTESTKSENRIKFSIPIYFHMNKEKYENRKEQVEKNIKDFGKKNSKNSDW